MAKQIRNQNQKNHPEPSIPIAARLAIQGYAEYPQYINLLPSVKRKKRRGKKRKERRGRGGEGERGRKTGHVHGK